jgi:hypothetical protein
VGAFISTHPSTHFAGTPFAFSLEQDISFAQLIQPFTTLFSAQYERVTASPKHHP